MESSTSFNDVVIVILEKGVAGVFAIDNLRSVMMELSSVRLLVTTVVRLLVNTTITTKKGK